MKASLLILLALCATACADGRGTYNRVKLPGAPEFRFSGGGFAVRITPGEVMQVTRQGRTIRYQDGELYVDDRRLPLPAQARVVHFDGLDIYVDGHSIDPR
jgi:hypothetical protein